MPRARRPLGALARGAAVLLALAAAPAAADETMPAYEVTITGVDDPELKSLLEQSSQLGTLEAGDRALERYAIASQVARDRDRLKAVLDGTAHYNGTVKSEVDAAQRPVRVTFRVDPGPLFQVSAVRVRTLEAGSRAIGLPVPLDRLEITVGDPATGARIVGAEPVLSRIFAENGFPLARVGERRVAIDRRTATADVTYYVDSGPKSTFGATEITGLDRVSPRFVERRIDWERGQLYDARRVDETDGRLAGSGLFENVVIAPAPPAAAGAMPVGITVKERKPRTVGAGITYSTNEGPGGRVFWRHRNLFGEGEQLDLELGGTPRKGGASIAFAYPGAITIDDTLRADAGVQYEEGESYSSRSAGASLRLERRFSDRLTASTGLRYEFLDVKEDDDLAPRDRMSLLSVPTGVTWSAVDDLLDPTEGARTDISLNPYLRLGAADQSFFSMRAEQTLYYPVLGDGELVLAGRGVVGTILGESRAGVPAPKRFYAGGAGSVRPYGYQKLGPLNADGDPTGGRSLLEFNLEARFRFLGDYGIVPFLDGGSVAAGPTPDFSALRWGAGLGFRYYTVIGPIRLDVAVPFDPRKGIDSPFQIYVSVGQAF